MTLLLLRSNTKDYIQPVKHHHRHQNNRHRRHLHIQILLLQ